jgi:hypothetical protein
MNQTKAEQLAQDLDAYHTRSLHKEAAIELRRLSPMEGLLVDAISKRDKLLEVNKVLVDALKEYDELIKDNYSGRSCRLVMSDLTYAAQDGAKALKLAGESE